MWCPQYSPLPSAGSLGAQSAARAWADAGIVSTAKPWPWPVTVGGTALGVCLFALAFPVLCGITLLVTLAEALRFALGLDPYAAAFDEGSDEEVTLVLPGTCAYIFWQLGMVQYICERFDTRSAKLAGISSGAASAVLVLALEEAAAGAASGHEAAQRVRRRAQEIFGLVEAQIAPVTRWPLGFVSQLGSALDRSMEKAMPSDGAATDRLRIGVRRLSGIAPPAFVPGVVTGFKSQEQLKAAVQASTTVWLVVRATPGRWLKQTGTFCGDGVNPFSFFAFFEYWLHLRNGLAQRTAPAHTRSGGLDQVYAIWNCSVMRSLLPRRGHHVWLTPTVGGRLGVVNSLRFSAWFLAQQWRQGYVHARDLDREGYFAGLQPRPL